MSSKIKLTGYKHELFVVDNRLATDFFYLVTDNQIKNEFIKFHETQRSGWADDTIIKDFKRRFESARTLREETYDSTTEKATIKKTA